MQDILIAAFLLFALCGLYLLLTGKDPDQILKREIRRLEEQHKNGPPIVYLRSFKTEKIGISDIGAALAGKTLPGTGSYWKDVGDQVTGFLKVIGPAKELARPEGAHRLRPWSPSRPEQVHADDAGWQRLILEWLPSAALVVVQLDMSPGLGWELQQLARAVPPVKILLVLPPAQAGYTEVREWGGNYFPKPLPEKLPDSRLLTFRPDWTPLPLEFHSGGGYSFWFTLEEVFDQNGFEAPPWRRVYKFGPKMGA